MDLTVVALTFGAIFVVELPDKTFIAALVLSTRYRGLLVWIGVGLAFLVQTLIAVAVGRAAHLLPEDLVHAVAAVVFLLGAVLLAREAPKADARKPRPRTSTGPRRPPSAPGSRRSARPSWCCSPPSGATSPSCSRSAWSASTASR